jgi:hypothetical protein
MQIDLSSDDASALFDVLRQHISDLDKEIYATENRRFKEALRGDERQLERILEAVRVAIARDVAAPTEWEARDNASDEADSDRTSR